LSEQKPFNIWTSLYDFYTKTVPSTFTTPTNKLSLSNITNLAGPPPPTTSLGPQLPDIFKSLQGDLEAALKGDPKGLPALVRSLIGTAILAASALSFIPGTNNFGGALASVLIHQVLDPFRKAVYDGTIDLALRPLFPTADMNTRLLVSGIEAGALEFEEVIEELTRAGTRPESVMLAAKIARVKRFDNQTKDDFATVRTYHGELIKEAIAAVKDQEKAVIADLKSQRANLVNQLGALQTSGSA